MITYGGTSMKTSFRIVKEYGIVWCVGAVLYSIIEILFRGYTHWTMTITGGVCLMCLYANEKNNLQAKLWKRCLAGSVIITTVEFLVGCIVNIHLGWDVWDYSDRMFNILGQICPLFSVLWLLLCIPGAYLCRKIRNRILM